MLIACVSQPSYAVEVHMYELHHIIAALVSQAFGSCVEYFISLKRANHIVVLVR
jgi:hypothetical protein